MYKKDDESTNVCMNTNIDMNVNIDIDMNVNIDIDMNVNIDIDMNVNIDIDMNINKNLIIMQILCKCRYEWIERLRIWLKKQSAKFDEKWSKRAKQKIIIIINQFLSTKKLKHFQTNKKHMQIAKS